MSLFSKIGDLFGGGNDTISYHETPLGQSSRSALEDAVKVLQQNLNKSYQGPTSVTPSSLRTSAEGIASNNLSNPFTFQGLNADAFDKLKQDALASYDAGFNTRINPIIEASVASGNLKSPSGANDVLSAVTADKLKRAQLGSSIDLDKLNFLLNSQTQEKNFQNQDLGIARDFSLDQEALNKFNLLNNQDVFYKNLNIPNEVTNSLRGIESNAQSVEGAKTNIDAYNSQTLSPIEKLLQIGLSLGDIGNSSQTNYGSIGTNSTSSGTNSSSTSNNTALNTALKFLPYMLAFS